MFKKYLPLVYLEATTFISVKQNMKEEKIKFSVAVLELKFTPVFEIPDI